MFFYQCISKDFCKNKARKHQRFRKNDDKRYFHNLNCYELPAGILGSKVKDIINSALPEMPKKLAYVAQENFLNSVK
jgi:hypothetical protein